MAHCFRLKDYHSLVGKAPDTKHAMLLPDLALPSQQWLSDDAWSIGLDPLIDENESMPVQLFALLSSLLTSLSQPLTDQPVYLLLPESMEDAGQLAALTRLIRQQFPELLMHQQSRVFPFGACSALLALKTIQHSWLHDPTLSPWMIAIDSPLQQYRLRPELLAAQPTGYRPVSLSEGIVAVQWAADASGLQYLFNETELTPQHAQIEEGMQALFTRMAQLLKSPLTSIYLPDNGNAALAESWLAACGQLHPWLTAETSYEFLAYQTGELGSAGGLYRLLHLYLAHHNQVRSGLSLQSEQGQLGFRSAAVFYWQSAATS
ncbi:hypothetical protein [Alkalimonas sp.]|uniref:hypothetical protein n=1 Tax=Alkalimonas sp. TaxID=1872453 RepID=UPI00263A40DF|nr:hypothetical protein [Alkalimonas sp.]MCC5827662.1 hypothetical protein [Alkalimonas sp.]